MCPHLQRGLQHKPMYTLTSMLRPIMNRRVIMITLIIMKALNIMMRVSITLIVPKMDH